MADDNKGKDVPSADSIVSVIAQLFDPGDSPAARRRHTVLVALFILAYGLHVVWSCGYLERFGIAGFASSASVRSMADSINKSLGDHGTRLQAIEVRALETQMLQTATAGCEAIKAQKEYFSGRMIDLQQQYFEITKGQSFKLPQCAD